MATQFGADDTCLFGVFDGHGENGTPCSVFARDRISELLHSHTLLASDPEAAHRDAFVEANKMLHRAYVDDSMSGTTAITVFLQGRFIYVANVGDSRAVIAEKREGVGNSFGQRDGEALSPRSNGGSANSSFTGGANSYGALAGMNTASRGTRIRAMDLSHDQTPFRADECARVRRCGARVLTLDQLEGLKDPNVECWGDEDDDEGDPPRLWAADGLYPGTAFTRSIGDLAAEKIGVCAEPEVLVKEITPANPFIIIASDGVWEFLPSQTVVDMVSKYDDPQAAAAAVVQESYRLWLQYETRTDDITCIVIQLCGLNAVGAESLSATSIRSRSKSRKSIFEETEEAASAPVAVEQRRVRRGLSRAKRRAIEASASGGANGNDDDLASYVPPVYPKTPEETTQLEAAVRANFLFAHLTDEQRKRIFDAMKHREVKAGEVVITQGSEGDNFYIVDSGTFDVFVQAEKADEEKADSKFGHLVHTYNAAVSNNPSFGELALIYRKERAATVMARSSGALWALDRNAFRSVLMKTSSNRELLKALRGVEIFKALTGGELQRLVDAMSETSFKSGTAIIRQGEPGEAFYIIKEGSVSCTIREDPDNSAEQPREVLRLSAKDGNPYFGERALLNAAPRAANVVALTPLRLLQISRSAFEDVLGPLQHIIDSDRRWRETQAQRKEEHRQAMKRPSIMGMGQLKLDSLSWLSVCYSTRTSTVGLARLPRRNDPVTVIMISKSAVAEHRQEEALRREVALHRELSSSMVSRFIPPCISEFEDERYLCAVVNSSASLTLDSVLSEPVSEPVAKFLLAQLLLLLEHLHREGVVFRGVASEHLLVDMAGRLQVLDLRFAKRCDGATYTLCGTPDYLSPEIINGSGHDGAADVWAAGVLLFSMLCGELPFSSEMVDVSDESELKVYNRICQRDFRMPMFFSASAVDLIDRMLKVDPAQRLTIKEARAHPFFTSTDWEGIANFRTTVPSELSEKTARLIEQQAEGHPEDLIVPGKPYKAEGDDAWWSEFW